MTSRRMSVQYGSNGGTGREGEDATRPQQGGEGGTTRFGMEDGDNTDVPATGGVQSDEEEPDR